MKRFLAVCVGVFLLAGCIDSPAPQTLRQWVYKANAEYVVTWGPLVANYVEDPTADQQIVSALQAIDLRFYTALTSALDLAANATTTEAELLVVQTIIRAAQKELAAYIAKQGISNNGYHQPLDYPAYAAVSISTGVGRAGVSRESRAA